MSGSWSESSPARRSVVTVLFLKRPPAICFGPGPRGGESRRDLDGFDAHREAVRGPRPKALRDHLRELAALPGLMRIVPCHGRAIEHAPGDALRAVADAAAQSVDRKRWRSGIVRAPRRRSIRPSARRAACRRAAR